MNGTPINAGPYQGLTGLITPYTIEVTARTSGGAEVRMRREMQTVGIPVFQFGIFSENDLSFFAGPNFAFGGRVHTNQNLFLKQDSGNTLTLQDRVTAVGEVIRTHLANGVTGHARRDGARGAGGRLPGGADGHHRGLPQPGRHRGQPSSTRSAPRRTSRPGPTCRSGTYNGWLRNGRHRRAAPGPAGRQRRCAPDRPDPPSAGGRTGHQQRRPPALLQHGDAADPDVGPPDRSHRAAGRRVHRRRLAGAARHRPGHHRGRSRGERQHPAGRHAPVRADAGARLLRRAAERRVPHHARHVVDRRLHPDQPAGSQRQLDRRDEGSPEPGLRRQAPVRRQPLDSPTPPTTAWRRTRTRSSASSAIATPIGTVRHRGGEPADGRLLAERALRPARRHAARQRRRLGRPTRAPTSPTPTPTTRASTGRA